MQEVRCQLPILHAPLPQLQRAAVKNRTQNPSSITFLSVREHHFLSEDYPHDPMIRDGRLPGREEGTAQLDDVLASDGQYVTRRPAVHIGDNGSSKRLVAPLDLVQHLPGIASQRSDRVPIKSIFMASDTIGSTMEPRSVEGQFVDVIEGKVYPARVSFADGRVLAVERLDQAPEHHILPGFVEAHIHIESSQLCPSRFAEAAVPHGTTSVINDPHEISNVLGMTGVRYMLEDAKGVPLRTYFTAPSCVPSTKHDTSGAVFGKEEIDLLLRMKEFVALGEVMDFQAVLRDDNGIKEKIKVAREYWKPVDGHCPGLIGGDLVKYINAGISSDHESLTADEAEEKFHLGMWIMVQEGSANRNLGALLPFAKANECFLVSDDLQATDLMRGHLDLLLRKAVALGMDPIHAIRAVTAWPSWHYFLPGGSLAKGKVADIVIVDDLKDFNVKEVYVAGDLVAKGGKALFTPKPVHLGDRMAAQHRQAR